MFATYEGHLMRDLFSSSVNPSYGMPTLPDDETEHLTIELRTRILNDAEQNSLSNGTTQYLKEEQSV
ncbi:hypothetical protein [Exiguobacterium flavidum]|uniref:hypothetical protein n=1 Tax=Exiguobacterium flavidum TaxID=2184695 RepID=UPI000DF85A3E|nr:hypothetical protein [Exiguobacterium flavidum]